jgi:type IX secretion system PorP/SprF family membrane protein
VKEKIMILMLCFIGVIAKSQQTMRYNQYILNSYLMNPAYAGTNNKWEFMTGRRQQWIGFDFAPTTLFASMTYTYRKNFNYKGWHGFGAYVEQDRRGSFANKSVYVSYAYHFRISGGYKMAFGVFVGAKSVALSNAAIITNDPAFSQNRQIINLYPDIIPGYRLYSKKMFLDISVRQLTINRLQQGNQEIGTNSKLIPTLYFTYGQKFNSSTNDFTFVPSTHVQWAITGKPLVDAGIMVFYRNQIGLGTTLTFNNSFTTQLQVQALKNIVFGFAYNYATNGMRNAAANTVEVIFGFTPVMSSDQPVNRNRVARCPGFDY